MALVQPGENSSYAAVIGGEAFFTLSEQLSATQPQDQLLLVDAAGQYFFHRTAQGIRAEAVEDALASDTDAHSGLRQLLETQQSGRPDAAFFQSDSLTEGTHHTARIAILPAPGNVNGCFTVGIAGSYDRLVRPLQSTAAQMIACSGAIVGGAAMLLLFLLRSRRNYRQTQAELELLRQKARAMEELGAQTRQIAHSQRLETIGTLTSGIAHEFNNLLTPIMGYSILILEKLPQEDTESYDNALEIYNATQKAKNIISRLSNLSRKNTPQAFRAVRLDRLIGQVLEVAGPAQPKTVRTETGFSCGGQEVLGDETQLFQMKAKDLIAPAAALLAAAAVLLAVSAVLRPMAEEREAASRAEIMSYMLPTRPASFSEEAYDGEDESIRRVFKAEGGYVIEVCTAGYAGEMLLWVGVTDDGTVSGVTVRDHAETFGLGGRAQNDASFLLQFLGANGGAAVGETVDALTGATVTSKAVTRAVNAAAGWVTGADVSSGATEWGG